MFQSTISLQDYFLVTFALDVKQALLLQIRVLEQLVWDGCPQSSNLGPLPCALSRKSPAHRLEVRMPMISLVRVYPKFPMFFDTPINPKP